MEQPSQQITDVKFYQTYKLTKSEEEKDNYCNPLTTEIELTDEVNNITTTIKTLKELQTHVQENFSNLANSKGKLYVEFKLNNNIYRGEINKYGLLTGIGAIIYSNGERYVGEFNEDNRDWTGTFYYSIVQYQQEYGTKIIY